MDGSADIAPRPHDDDSLTVNVVKAADLSLTKSVDTGYIHSGDSVTYTFAVHNAGPDVAREVVIDDNWPAALASNLQVTGAVNWSLTADDRLVINLGNIASGGTDVVTVAASASSDTPTTVRNVASITDSADVYDRDSATGPTTPPSTSVWRPSPPRWTRARRFLLMSPSSPRPSRPR